MSSSSAIMHPSANLPVELWLEILSYLPRSALHRMIGINRFLFDLALDDLYEEVRFISNDTEMWKTFQQLEFASIAKRVRRLLVRPAFLPAMDLDPVEEDTFSLRIPPILSRLNCFKSNAIDIEQPVEVRSAKTTEEILQLAKKALRFCPNIQDLTVVLHDHNLTPPFVSFLNSLWKEDSLGPRLRTLRMDMTLSKIPTFLKPLITSPKVLRNLEAFSIDFAPSRFDVVSNLHDPPTSNSYLALASLRLFFLSFKDLLTDISISTHNAHDFSTFLPPHFPNLKKVEILTIFRVTAHQTAPLFQFLSAHSNQLEELTVKPYPRQTSFGHSDHSYAIWINDHSTNGLGKLTFSQLKTFDVGLRERPIHSLPPGTNPNVNAKLLPDLSVFAPNLKRLVMTDGALSFGHLKDLIDALSELESIEFVAAILSPQTFDLLAAKVPQLKELAVEFRAVSELNDEREVFYPGASPRIRFVEAIRARRYTSWKLEHLRVSAMSSCGQPHPDIRLVQHVAEAFPLGVEVDATYRCCCDVASGSV